MGKISGKSDFLENLIASTKTLSFRQARSIDRMGAALTGKNGILRAVIQFADVLKTFAQFGKNGAKKKTASRPILCKKKSAWLF